MADLLKIFKDIGEAYANDIMDIYNEFDNKNIAKIALYDLKHDTLSIEDPAPLKNRLFLHVTSPNGGNLYPFFFYDSKKFEQSFKKALKNMRKYLPKNRLEEFEAIEKEIDFDAINRKIEPYNEKNLYFALLYDGKSMSELFNEVAISYTQKVCEGDLEKEGASFFDDENVIGYDPGLNFCSVNELPKSLQKIKYRLLPLSKDEACLVKLGFRKVFEDDAFRLSIFGLYYYLLPTIFSHDKRPFFDLIASVKDQELLEKRIRRLVKELEKSPLHEKVLLSFLFAHKSNNAIDLLHLIEDVAPSRIKKGLDLMEDMQIHESASRYVKKSERIQEYLYIRDYIDDRLLLAKLLFGKERIRPDTMIGSIAKKILYGDNRKDADRRSLSEALLFESFEDFEKHQRVLDFFHALGVLDPMPHYLYKEFSMQDRFSEIAKGKFDEVELLRLIPRAREFYALGALSRFVMDWQYSEGGDSFRKYLDSLGAIGMHNADRIFRKAYDISRKYDMYGETYDDLLTLYAKIKEQLTIKEKISLDEATIAFVMGAVDFKEYKNQNKEIEHA